MFKNVLILLTLSVYIQAKSTEIDPDEKLNTTVS